MEIAIIKVIKLIFPNSILLYVFRLIKNINMSKINKIAKIKKSLNKLKKIKEALAKFNFKVKYKIVIKLIKEKIIPKL